METEPSVECAMCGRSQIGRPLDWMYEPASSRASAERGRWYCAGCARANVQSVEAKLDQQWW